VDFPWLGFLDSHYCKLRNQVEIPILCHIVVDQMQHMMMVHMMVQTLREIINVPTTAGGLLLIQVVIQPLLPL
jgi:hypothetical protein